MIHQLVSGVEVLVSGSAGIQAGLNLTKFRLDCSHFCFWGKLCVLYNLPELLVDKAKLDVDLGDLTAPIST